MPSRSTASAEASLINDVEFLEELERGDYASEPALDSGVYEGAFDALETGLPIARSAKPFLAPHHERAPIHDQPVPFAPAFKEAGPADYPEEPQPVESSVSFAAAAIVILLCLSAGGATAALVFHDTVSRITSLVTASR